MATLSFDSKSLLLDGRRLLPVAGDLDYLRVPREAWAERIEAARAAGLNAIRTSVTWAHHEPKSGRFDFSGDADLRAFLLEVRRAGLFAILRLGPAIDDGTSLAGVPEWLLAGEPVRLREPDPAFLKAASRFLGEVFERVHDLQLTPPTRSGPEGRDEGGGNGPILMVQVEDRWFCHHPEAGPAYLGELVSYCRQNGCTVPLVLGNNLWQRVEGAASTWVESDRRLATLRQLRSVAPDFPPLLSGFEPAPQARWSRPAPPAPDPGDFEVHLAEIFAAAAGCIVSPFHGGTFFGTSAGRAADGPGGWLTPSRHHGAPLGETGRPGPLYAPLKRWATFATSFGHLFSHAEPERSHHASVLPDAGEVAPTLVHHRGPRGEVILIIRSAASKARSIRLLLSDGRPLEVPLGEARTAWVVLGSNLGGVAELDWSNLRPWTLIDRRLLVLFGPPGSEGEVSINRSRMRVQVPTGRAPARYEHEGLDLAILNTEQVDAALPAEKALYIGARPGPAPDAPRPLEGWPEMEILEPGGTGRRVKNPRPAAGAGSESAPRLTGWQQALLTPEVTGDAAAYQPLDGPASLARLGARTGYAWYRIERRGARTSAKPVLAPGAGDRLHVYRGGRLAALIGEGPGAERDPVPLKLGGTTTLLAHCAGRFGSGWRLGEPRGLPEALYAVRPARLGRPRSTAGGLPDPFTLRAFLPGLRQGERLAGQTLTFPLTHQATRPVIIDIDGFDQTLIVSVNDRVVGLYDPHLSAGFTRLVLRAGDHLKRGKNTLAFAAVGREAPLDPKTLLEKVRVLVATENLTENARWSAAPCEPPAGDRFEPLQQRTPVQPCWYRAHFELTTTDHPVWFEPRGLSCGRVCVNGRDVGAYWQAEPEGRRVGPQKRLLLPAAWLRTDAPNELSLFDEHGKQPGKTRLNTTAADAFE